MSSSSRLTRFNGVDTQYACIDHHSINWSKEVRDQCIGTVRTRHVGEGRVEAVLHQLFDGCPADTT